MAIQQENDKEEEIGEPLTTTTDVLHISTGPSDNQPLQADFQIQQDPHTKVYFYIDQDLVKYEWDSTVKHWFPSADQSLFDNALLERNKNEKLGDVNTHGKHRQSPSVPENHPRVAHSESQGEPRNRTSNIGKPSRSVEKGRKNTSVYVQGLPSDISVDELNEYFSHCGIIMTSLLDANQPRIKIYLDSTGTPKGDALVTFLMEESVDVAVSLYDQSQIRPGCLISVKQAEFDALSEQGNPKDGGESKQTTSSEMKRQMKIAFDRMKRKLAWDDVTEEPVENAPRTVLLKGMFDPAELNDDSSIAYDIKADVRDECEEKCGPVTKISLFPDALGGLMTVRFKNNEGAVRCIQLMNGRWFDGRRIEASMYEGSLKGEETI